MEPSEIEDRIRSLVVERLFLRIDPKSIGREEALIPRLGIDSVQLFEVLVACEEAFGISLQEEEFRADRFATIAAIAATVKSKI